MNCVRMPVHLACHVRTRSDCQSNLVFEGTNSRTKSIVSRSPLIERKLNGANIAQCLLKLFLCTDNACTRAGNTEFLESMSKRRVRRLYHWRSTRRSRPKHRHWSVAPLESTNPKGRVRERNDVFIRLQEKAIIILHQKNLEVHVELESSL